MLRGAGLVLLLVALRHRGDRARPGRAAAARAGAAGARRRPGCGCRGWAAREALRGAAAVVRRSACSRFPSPRRSTPNEPWWDYRAWNWFGGGNGDHVRLDPLVRPARLAARGHHAAQHQAPTGRTTGRPRRSTRFDGFRWVRTPGERSDAGLPSCPSPRPRGRRWDYFEYNPRWDEEFDVTVRSLLDRPRRGGRAPPTGRRGAGTRSARTAPRGSPDEPLEKGDSYTVAPTRPIPTPAQMRGTPDTATRRAAPVHGVPCRPGRDAREGRARATPRARRARRAGARCSAARRVARPASPTRPTRWPLALRRTSTGSRSPDRGAPTRLRRGEGGRAPSPAQLPLQRAAHRGRLPARRASCSSDRLGYCQQFSGAMALMLRMAGIPTRVAAGFSPGSYNRDTGEYRVRDLDAHSWVEVYFNGIGWVPFDPTPDRGAGRVAVGGAGADERGARRRRRGRQPARRRGRRSAEPDRRGRHRTTAARRLGWSRWSSSLLALRRGGGLVACAWSVRAAASRSRAARRRTARRAAPALAGSTGRSRRPRRCSALEQRLGRAAGPASARYAAGLRAHRYDPRSPAAPGRARAPRAAARAHRRARPARRACAASSRSRRAARARLDGRFTRL